jgi:uncharacterized protein YndB with AHSA1/START domain
MLALAGIARSEVIRATEGGFTVRHQVTAAMPPPAVWSAMADVGRWWDPEHTYSGDARNMTLEPFVGGCFCERLGMYAGIQHMAVIYAQPPKTLRLSGALGPLQEFAVTGSMTFSIEPASGGSKVTLTYTASGFTDRPMSDWAPLVDSVLGVQLQRLGRLIATGNPADGKAETK